MPIADDWWVGVDLFEPAQAEPAYVSVDVADGCETDTDGDQTERWHEVAVYKWAGLRDEFADA